MLVHVQMGTVLSYFESRLRKCDTRLDDLEAQVTKQEIDLRFLIGDLYAQLESLYPLVST